MIHSDSLGCTVCYQSKTELHESDIAYTLCLSCDQPICTECLESWAVQQIEKRHYKNLEEASVKCHHDKCHKEYTIGLLQRVFKGRHAEVFERIDRFMTLKVVRASDQYVSCPN